MATILENTNRIKQGADDIREVINLCYEEVEEDERIEDYAPKLARLAVDTATEQVISTAPRTTAGGVAIKDSIAVVDKIYGNTLVWNQLCDKDNPTKDLNISGITLVRTNKEWSFNVTPTTNTDLIFELTRMFGSGQEPTTIDDFCLKIFGKSSADVTDADWEAISAYCEPTLKSSSPKKIVSKPADNSWTSEISVVPTTIVDSDGNKVFPNGLLSAGTAKDYIDLERGVAVKCCDKVCLADCQSKTTLNTEIFARSFKAGPLIGKKAGAKNIKCDYYNILNNNSGGYLVGNADGDKLIISYYDGDNGLYVFINDTSLGDDLNAFKTFARNVNVVYELATPIEYPLPKRKCFYRVSNGGTEKITSDGIIPMVADITYKSDYSITDVSLNGQ